MKGVKRMSDGTQEKCCGCGHDGHTAHDLSWDEVVDGWVCEDCSSLSVDVVKAHKRILLGYDPAPTTNPRGWDHV